MNSKKIPVAILDVQIKPLHYFVDRVIRLFRCEQELIRKIIRFPIRNSLRIPGSEHSTPIFDTSNPNEKFVLCNNRDVVCSLSENSVNPYISQLLLVLILLFLET